MVDLLGPGDAGASPTLATTNDVTAPVAGDTWYQDCVGGVASTGTPIDSKWLNRLMQQVRAAIRASGVPLSNAYDEMLSWAMQSGQVNWVGNFSGTANALTGAADNAPRAVTPGTVVRGIIATPAANSGAATFNWSGLGAASVVHLDGSPCAGGDLVPGSRLELMWDGGSWAILTPLPAAPFNPITSTNVGALSVMQGTNSPGADPVALLGQTFSFSLFGGLAFASPLGWAFYIEDYRWGIAGVVPGAWIVQSLIIGGRGGVGVNATAQVVIVRIA